MADLARSIAFYRDSLGLTLASEFPSRGIAFFWIGPKETGMLGLWHAGHGPLKMTLHCAFRLALPVLLTACADLTEAGINPLGFGGEPVTEPVVIG